MNKKKRMLIECKKMKYKVGGIKERSMVLINGFKRFGQIWFCKP